MNPTHRRATRAFLKTALCLALLPVAWAAYATLQPASASPAHIDAAVPAAAASLPVEFQSIHPAGLDGTSPPIPPSELWPAQ